MKPIKFKGHNTVYAENQPPYIPLPVLKFETPEGEATACWKMSFKERLKVLFTGKIWVQLLTFNEPLTPSYVTVNRKEVFSLPEDEKSLWAKVKGLFA